jgi:phospholipase/carboxylesterase
LEKNMTKLSGLESKPASGKKAKQLIILLHGYGADGADLIELAPYFAEKLPDAHFCSPNAPEKCEMGFGYQWFSLENRSEEKVLRGSKSAAPILNEYIDEKKKQLGLEDKDVALIGFSQGTMMSLYVGLRRDKPLAGVLGYSGALIAPHLLKDEIKSKPEICLIHGEDDQVVPFDAFTSAMSVLQKQGVMAHGYSQPRLGHGIDPAGMKIGVEFLSGVFSKVSV